MLTYEELRSKLAIDMNNLDGECSTHPALFHEAGDLASDARAAAKAAKHTLDRVQAEIQLRYRSGAIGTDTKITETSILALVASHADVLKAKSDLVEAELLSSKCDSLQNAFDHRRSMLTNQVSLLTQSFYHSGDIKARRQLADQTEEEIRKMRGNNG